MARPPIQAKSKKRARSDRDARDEEQRAADEAYRKANEERALKAAATRRERKLEKARISAATFLSKEQLDALAHRFPWVTGWIPRDETFFELHTTAAHVTFDGLADLASALATRNINVVSDVTDGDYYYPEDATGEVHIEVHGDRLVETIRYVADHTTHEQGTPPA